MILAVDGIKMFKGLRGKRQVEIRSARHRPQL
jgi:hypothetical protein